MHTDLYPLSDVVPALVEVSELGLDHGTVAIALTYQTQGRVSHFLHLTHKVADFGLKVADLFLLVVRHLLVDGELFMGHQCAFGLGQPFFDLHQCGLEIHKQEL